MISNQQQLLLLWRCLGCGVCLNLSWVLTAQIRRRYCRTKPMRFLFDCVLTVMTGFCLFMFALAVSGGELRAVTLAAVAVGAVVSHVSLGRLLSVVLNVIYRIFAYADTILKACLKKTVAIWRKIRKKVEIFCKKHLQSKH